MTLLEREEDLAAIDDRIGQAIAGEGSLLIFEGPAGIGKTELLAAGRRRAAAQDIEVLAARSGELERSFGFGVVRQLFEPPVMRASAARRRSLLAGAAAGAAPVLGLEARETHPAAEVSSPDSALGFQHGLYWLAANLAEQAPLLISVDDVHWADAASLRWLLYLVRRLEGLPIVAIMATRPGEPGSQTELLSRLAAEPRATTRRPAALSPLGTARLVRATLGDEAEPEFCSACHEAARGNPFVVRALADAIREDAIPPTATAAAHIRDVGPQTVSRSVMARLARLPGGAAELSRAVAVLGTGAELHEAASLADLDETAAVEAADALSAAAILAPGRPLDFVHPVVRTAIYAEIPEAERAHMHARAARLLSGLGGQPERVAAHLLAADPRADPWVISVLCDAARDSLARGAPDGAVAYLRRAIREPAPRETRLDLLQRLLPAAMRAVDLTAFDDLGGDPLEELAADPEALLACGSQIATALYTAGEPERGTEVWEAAIETALERGRIALAIGLELELINWRQLVPSQARARLQPYVDRIESGTLAEARSAAAEAWWATLIGDRTADEAAQLAERALAHEGVWRDQIEIPLVLAEALLVLIRSDKLALAERPIERWVAEARGRGSYPSLVMGSYVRASLSYAGGSVARAESEARSVVETARRGDFVLLMPLWIALLVEVLIERGDPDAADEEFEKTGLTGEIPDTYWFGPLLFSRGRLRLAQSRTREGLGDLLEHGRRYERDGILNPAGYGQWASTAALGLAAVGESDKARSLVEVELDRAKGWGTPGPIGTAMGTLGLLAGGQKGIALLREAVAVLEPSSAKLHHARVRTYLGAALRRQGQRSEAREVLEEALDLAHRCGAIALADHARQELAATGARPRKPIRTGADALTASERRVSQMAAEGLANKEIAQTLFVTVKTVETHLGHAYQKLNISSRSELPARLREENAPLPPPKMPI
ncbi:MAG: LuxR C-terminal-related transcriptional regulator [Solirubrobacteraceae bacterium]